MKHHRPARKLSRTKNQRHALIKSLMLSLVIHERITTTLAKARELRPNIEKLVTKAKGGTIAQRRVATALIGAQATKKLFDVIAPKFADRKGGYTRLLKLPPRVTDKAEMGLIEFVQ